MKILTLFLVSLSTLAAAYTPAGFEDVTLGVSPSTVIKARPEAKAFSLGPEISDANEEINSVAALIESIPNGEPSTVMYKFLSAKLSSITFFYPKGAGDNLLLDLVEREGKFDSVEPSADKGFGMLKWNLSEDSFAYLSLSLDENWIKGSSAIYQIMSPMEVEEFTQVRNAEIGADSKVQELETFALRINRFLDESSSTNNVAGDVEQESERSQTAPEAKALEAKAQTEATAVTVIEEAPEESTNWLLWLIGALVVLGGLVFMVRRKS